jgi:hypothetical protein
MTKVSKIQESTEHQEFAEVVQLIDAARQHAYQAVNTALIELYWQIGAYISRKLQAAEWGDGVVDALANHLAFTQPNNMIKLCRHGWYLIRQKCQRC